MSCSKKMIRYGPKLSRYDILKGQPCLKYSEKDNASNTDAIKTRNSMDMNLKQ